MLVGAVPRTLRPSTGTVAEALSGPGRLRLRLRWGPAGDLPAFAEVLERELDSLEGVRWVEALPEAAGVVVAFDETLVEPDEILAAVEGIGAERGVPPPGVEHPADLDPIARTAITIGADVVALGISVVGRLLRAAPIPFGTDVTTVLGLLDSVPRFRQLVEERLGAPTADLVISIANGLAQGLNQGLLGPLVDLGYRSTLLDGLVASRRCWQEREPELASAPPSAAPTVDHAPRPLPLPAGVVERYADTAWFASLGAAGLNLAVWRSPERAAATLSAGLPKAARLGRETFVARAQRAFADRGVLTMNRDTLHVLDRVDLVLFAEDVARADGLALGEPLHLAETDEREMRRRLAELFSPEAPTEVRHREGWTLGPLDAVAVRPPRPVRTRARALARPDRPVLGLVHDGALIALVPTRARIRPGIRELIARAARRGLGSAIATDDADLARRAGARAVGGDERMAVRSLQLEGHVVALVTASRSAALAHADLAIGMHRGGRPVPWGVDVLCGEDADGLACVLDSLTAARRVSAESVRIAAGGAVVAGFLAFAPPVLGTGRRVMAAVNAASLLAIANAIRISLELNGRAPPLDDHPPWHALPPEAVLDALGSSARGLTTEVAARRRRSTGGKPGALLQLGRVVVDELANPLTWVLMAGAALAAVTGSPSDALLIVAVIVVDALLGGLHRLRAEREVAALGRTARQVVRVIRDGREQRIQARMLVPGDVVRLGAGEAVPADCRILAAEALEADESSLTGESLPVSKHPEPSFSSVVAERASMLYDGTTIAAGSASAVVVATGERTEAMRGLTAEPVAPPTGVEMRLQSLTRRMIPISLGAGAIVGATGLLRGHGATRTLAAGVSLAVAAVPEGLPLMATVAQTAAARRLSRRGALVRNPRAVEALGRVDVVCADKTGTLTEGRIALRVVSDGLEDREPSDLPTHHRRVLGAALRATPADPSPHPTDAAVEVGAAWAGVGRADGWPRWRPRAELPFEPTRGYHAVLGEGRAGPLLSVKGAPEILIPRCRTWVRPTGVTELGEAERRSLLEQVDRLARRGMRVLAVAERTASGRARLDDARVANLAFLGLVGLADPVRATARAAVDELRRAGVGVVMITGDHPSTAEGIAAELGILDAGEVVTGPELDAMSDAELDARLPRLSVYARVTPAHKVRIVQAFQRAGRVVAMTGDGANDAPAIRLADVGIALGSKSTSAARDAADVVVLDERIETIVEAVLEGRGLWISVRDAVALLIGGNLGEVAFTVLGSLAPGPPPLNARQLLLVNLLTDSFPAMSIALRPPRNVNPEDLLREGPDRSLGPALERAIAWRAAVTAGGAGLAYLIGRLTGLPGRARTIALVALAGSQLGQTLAVSRGNPAVIAACLGSAALLGLIVQTPGLSHAFGCRPLGPVGWATGIGSAALATGVAHVLPGRLEGLLIGREERIEAGPHAAEDGAALPVAAG